MWRSPGKAPGQSVETPAFKSSHIFDPLAKRRHGAIEWLPKVQQALERTNEFRDGLFPRNAPMLVPPRPWTRHDKGGSLLLDSFIMRGAWGPMGPAFAQLNALREEEARYLKARLQALGACKPWPVTGPTFSLLFAVCGQPLICGCAG